EYKASGRDITSRQLFFAQAEAMKDIASRESCVVVGRCGFHVFGEDPLALKVFVYAPLADRIERIEGRYNVREDKARQMISDHDYTRQLYTRTFTGKEWYDTRNYQLTLNAGTLGIEGAVDFLVDFVGKFWKGRMR
ncbi:MAG: cytidylate kinase-like family protein, partial [Prevotella sp.]|nr:cytidylate kinase-like family protein [Prevotella sp.]